MNLTRLLGALAVLCLIIMPAVSENVKIGCTCKPGDGCKDHQSQDCCREPKDSSCRAQICSCPSQLASLTSAEFYDPGSSFLGAGRSRQYDRWSNSTDALSSGSDSSSRQILGIPSKGTDPPDMDVVEYLPASAKQVFHVLAASGPLTKKDLISRTDLPPRTVQYALSRLKGEDMLKECFCFRDARQILYSLIGLSAK